MENAVKEIVAINGPYPPTFDGILNAVEACHYDQRLGVVESNNKLLFVHEDGNYESVLLAVGRNKPEEAYEAVEIAHRFGIEHDASLCQSCTMESQDFNGLANAIF